MIYLKANTVAELKQCVNLAISAAFHGHEVTVFTKIKPALEFKKLMAYKGISKHKDEELTPCDNICVNENLELGTFKQNSGGTKFADVKKNNSFVSLSSHRFYTDWLNRVLIGQAKSLNYKYHYPI